MDLLFSPYHVIRQFFSDFIDDEKFHVEKSLFQKVMALISVPFNVVYGMLAFVVTTWPTSRDSYAFLKALPVLAVLGTFGLALLLADFISTEAKRIGRNRGYIEYHVSNDTPEYCEMFARKLIKIKPEQEYIYQLGLAYHRNSEHEKAYDVMRSLAPDNETGFSMAHSWLAQHYSTDGASRFDTEERDRLISSHLQSAIEADPENQMAHFSMAMFHLRESAEFEEGSPEHRALKEQAVVEFEKVVNAKVRGITRFQLVSIPKRLELKIELTENTKDLKTELSQEIIRLQPLADIYPDEIDIRSTMVRCATLMEDYNRALAIVREGYQLASNDESRRKIVGLASMVYLERAGKFEDMTDFEQYRARIQTLCEAVKANPAEKLIYLKLLEFVGTVPVSEGILNNEWLDRSLTGCKAPAILHCLIGLRELSAGNVLAGEKHWRIAEQQFVNSKFVINNLLDVAAVEKPEEFENLMDMISLGIEMFKEQPLFYRTRGIYLTSLGKYLEAIPDLLYASEKLPNVVDVYEHLITCYQNTNQQELVTEQRLLLESKLGDMNEAERKRMEQVISKIKF